MLQLYISALLHINLKCSVVYSCDMISCYILQDPLQLIYQRSVYKYSEFVKDCSSTDVMDVYSCDMRSWYIFLDAVHQIYQPSVYKYIEFVKDCSSTDGMDVYSCDMRSWYIFLDAVHQIYQPSVYKYIEFVKDCSSTDGMDVYSCDMRSWYIFLDAVHQIYQPSVYKYIEFVKDCSSTDGMDVYSCDMRSWYIFLDAVHQIYQPSVYKYIEFVKDYSSTDGMDKCLSHLLAHPCTQDIINELKDNWMSWSSKRNETVMGQSTKRTLSKGRLALKRKGTGLPPVSNSIVNNINDAMTLKNERIILLEKLLKDLSTNTEQNIFSNDAMNLKNVYPNDAMTLKKTNMYSNDAMTYKDNDAMLLTNSYFNVSMTLKNINCALPFSKAAVTYEYIDDMHFEPHSTKSLVTHTTKDIYILLRAQYIELCALYIELYWSSVLLTLWTICTGAMAAHSYILRQKKYSQQPGLQYLAIGHQGADLSSLWRTDPLSPREEIIHTVWFIVVCVFKDVVAGVAYAFAGVAYSEPQGPASQSIFISLLIKIYAPGNVPGNVSTTAPAIAPAIAPTIATTTSTAPKIAQIIAPNTTPTITPTTVPIVKETIAPTIGPTIAPDIAPAIAPNSAPTIAPTIASTSGSTIAPAIAPNSASTTALMTTDSALDVVPPMQKKLFETHSIPLQMKCNISIPQMESSHPMNDASFNVVDERDMPNRICKLGHESGECSSNLNPEGDQVSCLSWSNASMTCTCTAALNNSVLCNPPTAPLACVTVQDALVRGYKKGLQRQSSQKESEFACEAEDPSTSSTEMVHTTINVVREFKGDAVDLVTGRGGGAKPRSQAQRTDAQCPMSQRPLDQVDIQDMPQNNAQLRRAAGNAPATIAPMALITTPPRIQIPSSTVTVDVILCEESKAIFNSATECLCSADYSHMIPLLKQITQHTCATQHCQALLFRHVGLGLAHYKMADHHEATKHFMEYRSLALTLARPADISLAHVYLGDISTIKSNYSNAAYHYLEAIHNYGTNNSSTLFKLEMPSVSALYAKQGAALKQTSQMLQAVEAFRNAIHHAPDLKSRLPVHNSLGNLLQSMGDYTGALQEYKEAVNLGEELNDLVSLGWAHGNLGNAHLGLHQKDAALHHLKKALALTIEHESTPQAISRAYNNLGTAYQSLEDFKGAEENFNLALDQAIYGNDMASQARARGNLGNLLMLSKKYERAIEQYSEVFRLSKDRQVLSIANHNRGCAYLEWAEQLRSEKKGATSGISRNLQVLCNPGTMVPSPGYSPTKLYRLGASDLTHAIELCNEVLQSTKGCTQGLSLSVSLIENNSRTFHKLQDCLIGLQQMDEALVVAEQCRARTLGERLLEKMGGGINHLTPPLSLEQIQYIVKSQEHPVVYLSYTGAKLIVWLIIPIYGRVLIDCRVVEVERLEKEKFGGKTFDQYVRQSVQEAVVGNDLELFQDVSGSQISPLTVLFDVVVFPVLDMLGKCKLQHLKNLILIPDSYTSLIPFVALHPEGDFNSTFGSTFSIQMMPSLLVMGILNEAHPTSAVMYNSRTACVVGNPHIPIFEHNDEEWSLGRLPHATDEAKWISQLLKVQPLLHEQATKVAVVTKLSSAQVIHIATHGSAISSFLAFAGPDSSNGKPSKSADILLLPSEVEQMNIKAALVVLSSCDSGRGMVRADGIIGMGRAFLLAGAQSILTTLWRIPDESAGMFMQFFYQYLVDGLGTTHALQKATLSVRCFRKYSQYTHWGGFQLIGRETYLHRTKTTEETLLAASLGPRCVFPQVAVVEKLEQGLIQTASQPSNVQVCYKMGEYVFIQVFCFVKTDPFGL